MKQYNTLYYLLFVLLIMGSFASMAQNDYGLPVLGSVAVAFAIIFALQGVGYARRSGPIAVMMELTGLVLVASILCLRTFYIHFPFVEVLFGVACLMVSVCYAIRLFQSWQMLREKNRTLTYLMTLFYGSIILYTVSMAIFPFVSVLAEPAGGAAFALLIAFVFAGLLTKNVLIEGDKISPFAYVVRLKDRSVVLAALFLLFTAYTGLTKIRAIPHMYSDKFPQAYFELVNQAESGKEKPVKGRYRHEEFKQTYDRLLERHPVDAEGE